MAKHKPILLLVGQHRNEKSAIYLAPRVAKYLQDKGHRVELIENPEKATLLEIVMDAYWRGKRLTTPELEQWWSGWQDSMFDRYRRDPIFALHNYRINATIFEPEAEVQSDIRTMAETTTLFRQFRPLVGNKYAERISISARKIEIPEIDIESLPGEILRLIMQVSNQNAVRRFETYLLSTDMKRTRAQGLLDDGMIDALATGIAHMVDSKWKEQYTYGEPDIVW
ncbi:hypothetical protein HY497_01185 [Candidatus Woesearchaeota archaeon]|nr:hypothetical protein [Candidatus Woesearchaeota archaeon]